MLPITPAYRLCWILTYVKPPARGRGKTNKMKQIKLQVGKTYRNREGEEVRITSCDGGYYHPYQGSNGGWYAESGKWNYFSKEDPEDLIEEVPETRHTFKIPNGTKEVTVEQLGNRIVVEMVRLPSCSTVDRKSTRLNSSHVRISYAVFCLKKKKKNNTKN